MQLEDKVLIVDKHAAHERINFEILRAGLEKLEPEVQMLLCPESLILSNEEAVAATEFQKEINASGFAFEIKDGRTALISGVPAGYSALHSGQTTLFSAVAAVIAGDVAPNKEFPPSN